jgi:hypothetical protein
MRVIARSNVGSSRPVPAALLEPAKQGVRELRALRRPPPDRVPDPHDRRHEPARQPLLAHPPHPARSQAELVRTESTI